MGIFIIYDKNDEYFILKFEIFDILYDHRNLNYVYVSDVIKITVDVQYRFVK